MTKITKKIASLCGALLLSSTLFAQQKGLIISEILTSPNGNDSPFEYVELLATANINFATTPYTVVFTDNGTATSNGWKAGSGVSYGFLINSGTVNAGQVVYVGGSSMAPLSNGGIALRVKNTGTSSGDSFGSRNSAGVLGNGGANCDGVAVFNVTASSITSSTVPVDAIFFGSSVGSAYKSSSSGYQMPINDKYNGGKLSTSIYLAPDPTTDNLVKATSGVFNPATNTFTTPRTFESSTSPSYNTTSITLASGSVNAAPTVSLATPVVSGNAPATITLTANATDSDGTITKVDFYNGTTLLATGTAAPYTFSWTNVSAGTYAITAKATDNLNATTTSANQTVTVTASNNAAPAITLVTPVVSGNAPATITLTANATDSDGTITKVDFYNGTTLLATDTATPYTFSWTNVSAGTYAITAKATDNLNAVTTTIAQTVVVKSNTNVAPTLSFNTTASKFVDLASSNVSCVMNNATDPVIVTGLDINVGDENLNTLVFSMTSSKTSVVPNANFAIVGTGNARKFKINPTGVGYTTITLKVTDAQGLNKSISLNLAVSAALVTSSSKEIYNTGVADGSTAIPIDENYMFVADDETNVIKLYSRNNSGMSLYQFDANPYLKLGGTEVDMEASFRSPKNPNRIYWIGSLSNSKTGASRPDRNRIFATDIVGTGANATLVFVGYYDNLRSKIIAWGDSKGYNFSAKAASGIEPKRIDGFNVEGLEIGPDGTTLYIGFRAPYVGTGNNKALICPLLNFESWFGNGSPTANPTFGAPIELNLNNHGIRSLGKNVANEYLIVAGSYAATETFELYSWNGLANAAPVLLNADLTNLKPEGIVDVPNSLTGTFQVDLISDLGSNILYNDGLENKDVVQANHRKFLTSTLLVTAGAAARISLLNKDVATKETNTTDGNNVAILKAYPNPTTADLTLEIPNNGKATSKCTIYTFTGSVAKEIEIKATNGTANLDVSSLQNGTYFIKIEGVSKLLKIIKQ